MFPVSLVAKLSNTDWLSVRDTKSFADGAEAVMLQRLANPKAHLDPCKQTGALQLAVRKFQPLTAPVRLRRAWPVLLSDAPIRAIAFVLCVAAAVRLLELLVVYLSAP